MRHVYILLLLALSLFTAEAYAQKQDIPADTLQMRKVMKNGEGKEFWICFMTNFIDQSSTAGLIELNLFITGDYDATITIEFAKINYREVVSLRAGEVITVKLDKMAQTLAVGTVDIDQAIHIVSDKPVTVYGLNKRYQTTDSFLAYPVEVLGLEYMVMGYAGYTEFSSMLAVVATEDNTEITVTPAVETTDGKPAGKPYKVTMNRGDVYQAAGKYRNRDAKLSDMSGSTVVSNKKVAVFGGHQCANIPSPRILACNHLVEQMPPIQTWGKHFYLGTFKMRSSYTYRVLAAHDNTKIFRDTSLLVTLMRGEYVEREAKENIQITADKPVLVAQYSQGQAVGDGLGDPMMLLVSPTQQFLKKYRFATPVNGDWHHFINVVVPTKAIKTFRINDLPIDADVFTQFGMTKFSVASIRLPFGSHTVECVQPFGLYSYGFGFGKLDGFDAYGTMGGQSFVDYEPAIDSVPPHAEQVSQKKGNSLLVTDDNVDDTGIFDIVSLEVMNMSVKIPSFSDAAPSVLIDFEVVDINEPAKFMIKTRDMSLNEAYYTVCYVYDNTSQQYVYLLNTGKDNDCLPTKSIILGAYYSHSRNNYSPDFNRTDGMAGEINFMGNTGTSGIFGVSASRYLFRGFNASAKLSIMTNDAAFSTVDTTKLFVTDSITGNYVPYYTGKNIELDNINLNLDLGLDYRISEYFYLSGGLVFGFALSKSADCSEQIFFPPGYAYENMASSRLISDKLSSLSSFNFGLYLGPGVQCYVGRGFYVFGDLNYYYYLTSMLNDADLFMNQFNLKFGIKYKLK